MPTRFNAAEVFEMAVRIEQNGARFYRKAAASAEGPRRALLLRLATDEDEHETTFAALARDLEAGGADGAAGALDPEAQVERYLGALADEEVFDVHVDPSEKLTGKESLEEVLTTAIGLEKDSIVFYLGIREAMPEKLGREKVHFIIREEMDHVAQLTGELVSLKRGKGN